MQLCLHKCADLLAVANNPARLVHKVPFAAWAHLLAVGVDLSLRDINADVEEALGSAHKASHDAARKGIDDDHWAVAHMAVAWPRHIPIEELPR